ncbi:MAG: DUF4149 domain-containing protein [Pyrinomonadaceae bacterium]
MTSHAESRPGRALVWINTFRLLAIGLWLGAAIFFSFSLAPSVFSILPSRELAGAVVQRNLTVINLGGVFVGALVLLLGIPSRSLAHKLLWWVQGIMLTLMTVAAAIGHWIIAARLREFRAQMGRPIELLPVSDPVRVAFDQLHGYSVVVLTIALIAALVAWLLIARQTRIASLRSG